MQTERVCRIRIMRQTHRLTVSSYYDRACCGRIVTQKRIRQSLATPASQIHDQIVAQQTLFKILATPASQILDGIVAQQTLISDLSHSER